jgi:hypothetical protein
MKLKVELLSSNVPLSSSLPDSIDISDDSQRTDILNKIYYILKGEQYALYFEERTISQEDASSQDSENDTNNITPETATVCVIHINYVPEKFYIKYPMLNKSWTDVIQTNISFVDSSFTEVKRAVYDVDNEILLKSQYFNVIMEDPYVGAYIDIPVKYTKDVFDYVFYKTDTIVDDNMCNYFVASAYFDLRRDDVETYFKNYINKPIMRENEEEDGDWILPSEATIMSVINVSELVKKMDVSKFMDNVIEKYSNKIKEMYLSNKDHQTKLYKHLFRNRHIYENGDFLLQDFFGLDHNLPKLVKNYDSFVEKFDKLSNDYLSEDYEFNWENIVVAGGSVLDSLHVKSLNENTDIDIWVYGTQDERKNTIIRLLKYFDTFKDMYFSFVGSVIYIWQANCYRCFQIINGNYPNIYSILDDFDFTCCMVAYNGNQVLCLPGFITALATNNIELNNYKMLQPKRLYKMLQKGFKYYFKDNEKVLYDEFLKNDEDIDSVMNKYYYPLSKTSVDRNKFLLKMMYNLKFVDNDIKQIESKFNFDNTLNSYSSCDMSPENLCLGKVQDLISQFKLPIQCDKKKFGFTIKLIAKNINVSNNSEFKSTVKINSQYLSKQQKYIIARLEDTFKNLNVSSFTEEAFSDKIKKFLKMYNFHKIISEPGDYENDEEDYKQPKREKRQPYFKIKAREITFDGKVLTNKDTQTNSFKQNNFTGIKWHNTYRITATITPYLWMNKSSDHRGMRPYGIILYAKSIQITTAKD